MSLNIPKVLLPSLVGVIVYIIVNRLFPEKVKGFEKDPLKNLRGGSKSDSVNDITKKILND